MNNKCQIVSESLLKRNSSLPTEDLKKFCLGIPDWCPCCVMEKENSSAKAKSLSLKRTRVPASSHESTKKTKESDERFNFDVTVDELSAWQKGECPVNTAKSTEWALRNFESWRLARNGKYPEELCPSDILQSTNRVELCKWLCKFISETRKSDGAEYTPRSLYLLLSGIQRAIRANHPEQEINIFQESVFQPLKNVCDSVFKQLHGKGIGIETKATAVFSEVEENILWDTGVISTTNPTGLLHAVFFYNGKNFCLRGGVEHRNLRISQLRKEKSVIHGKEINEYVYTEYVSKNNQGGFASLNLSNKVVHQYEVDSERCHVKILDLYLQKLPHDAQVKDIFYLRPLSTTPADSSSPWYTSTPVGKNTLNNMLKEMCRLAGIPEGYTNHSLRAFGATKLFQAGVSEKLIQQRTGHRSLEALRQYERTSSSQLLDVSNVMSNVTRSIDSHDAPKSFIDPCMPSVSSQGQQPTVVFNGCNFTGCSVAFSGNATTHCKDRTYEEEMSISETLKGLTYDDLISD